MHSWLLRLDGLAGGGPPPAPGAVQMARDEFALQCASGRPAGANGRQAGANGQVAREEAGVPSLRLYAWDRLTLSVGRGQQVERQIDLDACRRLGIPVVRRITGGRAVLHGSDLTYAVAAPLAGQSGKPGSAPSDVPAGGPFAEAARTGIPGIYRELSRVFLRFFEELGFAPDVQVYTGRQRAELASPVCFATPSAFETLLGGKKLVGSAQRLLPDAFLQHGSIPLAPQGEILAQIFRDGAGETMAGVMTDLTTAGVLPRLGLTEVRERLVACFAAEFGITLVPTPWSADESAQIAALAAGYVDVTQVAPAPQPR